MIKQKINLHIVHKGHYSAWLRNHFLALPDFTGNEIHLSVVASPARSRISWLSNEKLYLIDIVLESVVECVKVHI